MRNRTLAVVGTGLAGALCGCALTLDLPKSLEEFAGCYRIPEGNLVMKINPVGDVLDAANTRIAQATASVQKNSTLLIIEPRVAVNRAGTTIIHSDQADKEHLAMRFGGQLALEAAMEGSSEPIALLQEPCST
jgi:hypothetical protein